MKDLLFCLLLTCFLLGNTTNAFAASTEMGEGTELVILVCKTGEVSHLEIPERYVNEDGSLALSLKITLSQHTTSAYSIVSNDLEIQLPELPSGTYYVALEIGAFTTIQKISL